MNGILPKPVNTAQSFMLPARQLMPQPEDLSGQCHVRGNLFEVQPDVQAGAILHESPLAANISARGVFWQGLSKLRAKIFGGSNEQTHWRDLPGLDYEQLTIGKELKARSKPIIFYHPLYARAIPGIASWVESMRRLGIPLLYVNYRTDFREKVKEHQPDLILYSAMTRVIDEIHNVFMWSKENDPGAVSVIGGLGAVPHFANHMDYVVRGEGEIIGPALIKLLMEAIAEGGREAARPSLLGGAVRSLSAVRRLPSPDGGAFPISIPLGGRILMKEGERIVTGTVMSAKERCQLDRNRWASLYSGSPFPLTARQYAISTEPSMVNSKEIERLYLNPPPDDRGKIVSVHTQRGCVGLCNFCSIRGGYNGPRPEVAQLESFVYYMSRGWHSRREFMFSDDLFIQDEEWVRELLKKIRRFNFEFVFGTRVDRAPKDIVAMIKEMDGSLHFGLETLLPYRAEKMGKVGEGRGEEYIGKAIDTIDLLARLALEKRMSGKESPERIVGDNLYIILAVYGDSIMDVFAEVRADLEVLRYMWEKYRYVVPFTYNSGEVPNLGNHKAAVLTGYPYSQPGNIDHADYKGQNMIYMQLGEVEGWFYVFEKRDNGNGSHRLSGIFEPDEYIWPEAIKKIMRDVSSEGHPFTALKGIYETLLGLEEDVPKDDLKRIGELIEYLEKDEAFLRSDVGK